ncbi:hypothetical protein D3C75_304000 [compost metagenome]
MDQSVNGRGGKRIATHQQGMKRERLAQLFVLDKARDHTVDAAPGLQTSELRPGAEHIAKREKRHRTELEIALFKYFPRVGVKLTIPLHIARIKTAYLLFQPRLNIVVIKHLARLPAQAIKRRHRQQFDIILHLFSGQGK